MLTVISPAKSLDMDRTAAAPRPTQPRLLDASETLVGVLRKVTASRLGKLMNVSDDLAKLNAERYKAWSTPFNAKNARRAILAFDGDVYGSLERDAYDKDDFAFAQRHVRILSGLYGLLRPLDLVQAYRLEMGTKLKVNGARDLYDFWGDTITDLLSGDLGRSGSRVLVNLASDEYFRAVRPARLDARVVKPVFKEKRAGKYKVIAFSAKRARGAMVDFMVRERITDPDDLRGFDRDDYRFNAKLSTDDEWAFTRG